jgi:hypothetical protein
MNRYLTFSLGISVILSTLAIPLRAANEPRAGKMEKTAVLWTNEAPGALDTHPHRYRDTFAVNMLARGASPYDVAKLLGDIIETVEKHYMSFVKELRDRVRRLRENNEGLENWAQFGHSDPQTAAEKPKTN